jgi:hypothetical protein
VIIPEDTAASVTTPREGDFMWELPGGLPHSEEPRQTSDGGKLRKPRTSIENKHRESDPPGAILRARTKHLAPTMTSEDGNNKVREERDAKPKS